MTEESCVTLVLDFALALFAHFATNFRVALRMTLGATAVDHVGAFAWKWQIGSCAQPPCNDLQTAAAHH
jgi:hypothetical protein